MTDDKNTGDKTLHAPSKTLSLKRPVEAGVVRQSFSHGRSKAVVVEKVKRRTLGPGEQRAEVKIEPKVEAPAPVVAAPVTAPVAKAAAPAPAARAPAGRGAPQRPSQGNRPTSGSGVVLRTLTDAERAAFIDRLPKQRLIEPEEIAELIAFLLTPHSRVLHGAVLDASMGLGGRPGLMTEMGH